MDVGQKRLPKTKRFGKRKNRPDRHLWSSVRVSFWPIAMYIHTALEELVCTGEDFEYRGNIYHITSANVVPGCSSREASSKHHNNNKEKTTATKTQTNNNLKQTRLHVKQTTKTCLLCCFLCFGRIYYCLGLSARFPASLRSCQCPGRTSCGLIGSRSKVCRNVFPMDPTTFWEGNLNLLKTPQFLPS